ncbi:hypothetical protein I6J18_01910 [Peribacillus psychrosaccharolyticus]|uniref:Uncharacterized protein n=1 Tax=Peribacillus psychrosaccharolyticus TaxID=1407 RepID=A0A974S1W8_PERPY|nr:hypothetical protein [Peribacillus psychrosaccharolyticus]MEC2056091.1 hypothetical protein [Peribacillus psychrosaccharolyticus]MED3745532.1 hypothetical protein [Peribacillus psychrosaccharolyticus]QQT00715.1 hypothetical protein I6J18_01910 [Peribacillus psychrosaccharolyticus]
MSVTINRGENITTAIEIVKETYANLEVLFAEMDRIGEEEGYITLTPRFLRWKSDTDSDGWMTSDFIKLYQVENDPLSEKLPDLRTGSLFGVEIDLEGQEEYPTISLIRYTYDYSAWTRMPAVSDHWLFYYPFRDKNLFEIDQKDKVWTSLPLEKAKKRYWGIQRAVGIDIPLIDITSPELIRTEIFQKLMTLPE